MKCRKQLILTGYRVQFVDLRELKPRTIHEEVYTLDKDGVDALALMGLNVADFITARYERGGYHVTSVERITPKRVIMLDLCQLWTEAAPPATGEAPAAAENVEAISE